MKIQPPYHKSKIRTSLVSVFYILISFQADRKQILRNCGLSPYPAQQRCDDFRGHMVRNEAASNGYTILPRSNFNRGLLSGNGPQTFCHGLCYVFWKRVVLVGLRHCRRVPYQLRRQLVGGR